MLMYIASITLNLTNIGETRLELIERLKGQYRGKTANLLLKEEKAYNGGAQVKRTNGYFDRAPNVSAAERSYIAGFLDGDGSIMAQLVHRKDYRLGYQIRVSLVFYQKTIHQKFLLELKEQLGYGYVRLRNDGMSEYTIVGLREVEFVLKLLYPFLRLKKALACDMLELIRLHPPQRKMTASQLLELSRLVDKTAAFNYSKKRTSLSTHVEAYLIEQGLYVPVETDC